VQPGRIQVDFDDLKSHYPTYRTLPKALQDFMDALNRVSPGNTPCCVQMSHALNLAGQIIPSRSYRRSNSAIGSYYYILAVDELEQYLAGRYGRGEEIKTASRRDKASIKKYLNGKQGILCFRSAGAGAHTELWDKSRILQDGAPSSSGAAMNQDYIFGQPRVVFWETTGSIPARVIVPPWLQGWWEVYDGNYYYYYFNDENVVTYTKTKPANTSMSPYKMPMNEGDVTVSDDETQITIDWNPADGGETQEIFTKRSPTTMNGTSNRYAPLFATKI
jgi:hypothetical protein